jgi:hypothetical protein
MAIWRVCWRIAALSLLPLACHAHRHKRARQQALHPTRADLASPTQEPPQRHTVCGIAGAENCWEVVGRPIR